jgi:hypothetical protein
MVLNAGRTLVGSGWNVVRTGWRGTVLVLIVAGSLSTAVLAVATWASLQPVPSLRAVRSQIYKPRLLDRNGRPLTVTFQNRWNLHDQVALYDVPLWLQQSFVMSEDQRFFLHKGVDWLARFHAAWQNLVAGDSVRGASTISEQVVRLLHPRERTLWARWLEGFEAQRLEQRFSCDSFHAIFIGAEFSLTPPKSLSGPSESSDMDTSPLQENLSYMAVIVTIYGQLKHRRLLVEALTFLRDRI